jgi:excinuclease ABC subunit A
MKVINELVDKGNTAIIIEHNIDVMLQGDNIIDLGPDGGESGGEIVASGTPEVVSKSAKSITAPFLKESLKKSLN